MQINELTAKVKAVNECYAYALKVYDMVSPIFAPLLGQKIEKADGSLLAKLEKLMPEFTYTPRLHVYKLTSNYTLGWTVKACVNDGHGHGIYHETTVYIGDLRLGVLTKIYPAPNVINETWRTDHTVEEILEKQRKAKEAKTLYEDARSACFPFGEG